MTLLFGFDILMEQCEKVSNNKKQKSYNINWYKNHVVKICTNLYVKLILTICKKVVDIKNKVCYSWYAPWKTRQINDLWKLSKTSISRS